MKLTVPLLRDLVMLALGSSGMAHELFWVPAPDMVRVWASIGLLLGPAALNSVWQLRNTTESVPPTPVGPSPAQSSRPPPGS